ncbi:MAG TPA: hypothetical protein PLH19_13970, partial [Anaerolineae bacterium]|nr:hypothetical protein [Anaerolineae bacterium]
MRGQYFCTALTLSLVLACNFSALPAPTASAVGETASPTPATAPASPATPNEAIVVTGGRTFYVAPNGDNAHPGSRKQPWATPGYGSRQLAPGDT